MKFDSYKDRVAIITGGGSGIGAEIARAMAEKGSHIVIFDIHSDEGAKIAELLEDQYDIQAFSIEGDVSVEQDVIKMVEETIDKFGRIDILVNNAGMSAPPVPTISQDVKDWQRVIDVNLRGSYLCSKLVGQEMVKKRYGKILMISSIAGTIGLPQKNSYSSSKAGVNMMTRTLASEWAQYNINVNTIAPGFILTPFFQRGIENKSFEKDEVIKMTPLGTLGQVEDVADAAIFLCSDAAKFITGVILPVDGGLSACGTIT